MMRYRRTLPVVYSIGLRFIAPERADNLPRLKLRSPLGEALRFTAFQPDAPWPQADGSEARGWPTKNSDHVRPWPHETLDFPHRAQYGQAMAVPSFDATSFLAAHCSQCSEEVLTCVSLAEDGQLTRACMSCDSPELTDFRELSADELIELGYEVQAARTCGNGGGCSAGGCGVRKET